MKNPIAHAPSFTCRIFSIPAREFTKMENLTYKELKSYICEDIEEFMQDKLDILQATSRVQVEYERAIREQPLAKLAIYLVLYKEGLKHNSLRADISKETIRLVKETDIASLENSLDPENRAALLQDLEHFGRLSKEQE